MSLKKPDPQGIPQPFRRFRMDGLCLVGLARGTMDGGAPAYDVHELAREVEARLVDAYLSGYFRGYRAAVREATA